MFHESPSRSLGLADQYVASSPSGPGRDAAPRPSRGWLARMEKVLDSLSRNLFDRLFGERRFDPPI